MEEKEKCVHGKEKIEQEVWEDGRWGEGDLVVVL